ncbi:hypothetical protein L249_4994 [Ophiocordyceps polyrhachis-furcata BCC 54312]|uniref:Protein BIG1 n=1 Tax=Ophiocordyceps polyrhachis-furcata BCC 54312 TaxID=1330021 RepID=A0A367L3J0_9HYPO|nr:hypothetical protein L249_4994 [Ophiocordyceps polyrhachis-furcata BCC 54312]
MRPHLSTAAALVVFSATVVSCRLFVGPSDLVLTARDVSMVPYITDGPLVRRQVGTPAGGGNSIELSPNKNGNGGGSWSDVINTECIKALSRLPRSTNPSGNCICYNLPSLNTDTGAFEADLTVYSVSDPRDDFAGISPRDINVGVQYAGASVTLASPQQAQEMLSRQAIIGRRQENNGPQLVQEYLFLGQIDKDRLASRPSMAELEALVTPSSFTLTAQNPSGRSVSTNVSLSEAAFLVGIFSDQVVQSDFGAAQAAVDAKKEAVKNGTVAFVLPGVQIMIFPVGLIITGVWVLIGTTVYGIGTYQRALYAKAWRRRIRVATQVAGRPI